MQAEHGPHAWIGRHAKRSSPGEPITEILTVIFAEEKSNICHVLSSLSLYIAPVRSTEDCPKNIHTSEQSCIKLSTIVRNRLWHPVLITAFL